MKKILTLILILNTIFVFGQKQKTIIGQPTQIGYDIGCDDDGDVWLQYSSLLNETCCYDLVSGSYVKRLNCDDVQFPCDTFIKDDITGIVKCAIVDGVKSEISQTCDAEGVIVWTDCKTNVPIPLISNVKTKGQSCLPNTNGVAFLDCNCDYFISFDRYCGNTSGTVFYIQREVIRNCDQASEILVYFADDQVTELTQLQVDAFELEGFDVCIDGCNQVENVCFICENFAPPVSTVKPVKGIVKSIRKLVNKLAKTKIAISKYDCNRGDTLQVTLCDGQTDIDTTGFARFECESEIKELLGEVCIADEVSIDWSPICDTCIIGQQTIVDEPVEFLPIGISETTHSYDWLESGALDNNSPLVGCSGTYVPSTSIVGVNLHYDFSSIPECAVINSITTEHTGNGSSGNVWGVFDSSNGTRFTQTVNGGTITDNVWHVGNRSTCTASGNYTQTEFIGYPCLTQRPTTSETSVVVINGVSTGADLQDLVIRLMAINSSDFVDCQKIIVDYSLPNGCSAVDENGDPIGYEEKKVINVAIDAACSDTLVVKIAENPETCTPIETYVQLCDDTDNDGIGDVVYFNQIVKCYLGSALVSETSALFEGDLETPYVPIAPTSVCDPSLTPPTDRELLCDSGNGDKPFFQLVYSLAGQTILVDETELDGTTSYTVVGQIVQCPNVVSTQKACVLGKIGDGDILPYKGTLFVYPSGDGYFESYDGVIFEKGTYQEYCCDDCISYSDCYYGRNFYPLTATMSDGSVFTLGNNIRIDEFMQGLVDQYGGNYNETSNNSTIDIALCGNVDFHLFNYSGELQIESFTYATSSIGTPILDLEISSTGECGNTSGGDLVECRGEDQLNCKNSDGGRIPTINIGDGYTITTNSSCGSFTQSFTYVTELQMEADVKAWLDSTMSGSWNVQFTVGTGSTIIGAFDFGVSPSSCRLDNVEFVRNSDNLVFLFSPFANQCEVLSEGETKFAQLTVGKFDSLMLEEQKLTNVLLQQLIDKDCCNSGGGVTVTTNDVGVLFAYGQHELNTTGDIFNSTVTRVGVGRYNIAFGQSHPNGINYAVTFGVEEEANRDVVKASLVEGTRTANGFQMITTYDDNGGAADVLIDEPFSFMVAIDQKIVTDVQSN